MAQLQPQPVTTGKKKHAYKVQPRIDMTPLVDLGFLLITFFIFTTTLSTPNVTKLYMPAEGTPTTLCESCALTLLLSGDDSVHYYHGKWTDAVQSNNVHLTGYDIKTGLGNVIREKQKLLGENRKDLMLVIKPSETSTYKNLMNALDEVLINGVSRYAIVDIDEAETRLAQKGLK